MSCEGCPFAGACTPCKPKVEMQTPKLELTHFKATAQMGNIFERGLTAESVFRNQSLTEVTCKTCGKKYRPTYEFCPCPHCRGEKI